MLTFNQIKKQLSVLNRQGIEQLAKDAGIPIGTLRKIWNGATPNPGVLTVEKLSRHFEKPKKKRANK